jgi:hypothetical protein
MENTSIKILKKERNTFPQRRNHLKTKIPPVITPELLCRVRERRHMKAITSCSSYTGYFGLVGFTKWLLVFLVKDLLSIIYYDFTVNQVQICSYIPIQVFPCDPLILRQSFMVHLFGLVMG